MSAVKTICTVTGAIFWAVLIATVLVAVFGVGGEWLYMRYRYRRYGGGRFQ